MQFTCCWLHEGITRTGQQWLHAYLQLVESLANLLHPVPYMRRQTCRCHLLVNLICILIVAAHSRSTHSVPCHSALCR